MKFKGSLLVLVLSIVFTLPAIAQTGGSTDPQPVPVPNAPASTSSDPNDSGYTSIYLLDHDWTTGPDDNDDAFLRLEANRQRRGINPDFIGDMLLQAQQERTLNPQLLPGVAPAPGIPVWFNIGPLKSNHIQNGVLRTVIDSGRARTILPHPTDPNILYFLTSSGGLWKTTNFQSNKPNWVALTDSVITTSGGAAAFGRTPDTIYLGLGDPFDGNAAAGAYVLKSTDGGKTWGPAVRLFNNVITNPTFAGSIRDMKVDTSGPQDVVLVATDVGLFTSTDGGATFAANGSAQFLYQPIPNLQLFFSQAVWSIVNTSKGWVASTITPLVGIPATDGIGRLALSTDRGATWQLLAALSETFPAPTGTLKAGRTTLGVGAPGDATVYAFSAVQDNGTAGSQLDLFRSTDGGANWTPVGLRGKTPLNPNPDAPNMNVMGGQAFYNHMLLVDPNDANRNTVYLGGQLFSAKSADGGATWRVLADWLALFKMPYVHADYHSAAISPVTKQLFFGTDGGIFVSNDGGASWDDGKNEGIVTELAYSIAVSPNNPFFTIIGTQDNGTFSRVANTDIWEQTLGGDGIGTAWSRAAVNNDVAFSSFPGSTIVDIHTPPNIQNKWAFARSGINRRFANFFTAYATPSAAADPTGQVFYHYTRVAIYKTTNAGGLWTDIGHTLIPGLPKAKPPVPDIPPSPGINPARVFRDTPHGIGVSPAPDGQNHIAVVCNGGFVVVTHNGGASWTQAALIGTVPGWQGFNSNAEWADNTTIYIASESPIAGSGRVAKSTDGGTTFVNSSTGLPDAPVSRLVVSPVDKNTVYAATFLGVYRTTDGGAQWSRFGAGLPLVEVDDIYIAPDASFLRVASFGRGVWEIHP